ncbi:MAG: hypothetical protein HYY18_01740 [Planctomycetes bacterium]|nr:hypothetical protein [Planctomycetota bacterium]
MKRLCAGVVVVAALAAALLASRARRVSVPVSAPIGRLIAPDSVSVGETLPGLGEMSADSELPGTIDEIETLCNLWLPTGWGDSPVHNKTVRIFSLLARKKPGLLADAILDPRFGDKCRLLMAGRLSEGSEDPGPLEKVLAATTAWAPRMNLVAGLKRLRAKTAAGLILDVGKGTGPLKAEDLALVRECLEALSVIDRERAIELAMHCLRRGDRSNSARDSAETIARLGGAQEVCFLLEEWRRRLTSPGRSGDALIRHLFGVLGMTPPEVLTPVILECFASESDQTVLKALWSGVCGLPEDLNSPLFQRLVDGNYDPQLRTQALFAVSCCGQEGAAFVAARFDCAPDDPARLEMARTALRRCSEFLDPDWAFARYISAGDPQLASELALVLAEKPGEGLTSDTVRRLRQDAMDAMECSSWEPRFCVRTIVALAQCHADGPSDLARLLDRPGLHQDDLRPIYKALLDNSLPRIPSLWDRLVAIASMTERSDDRLLGAVGYLGRNAQEGELPKLTSWVRRILEDPYASSSLVAAANRDDGELRRLVLAVTASELSPELRESIRKDLGVAADSPVTDDKTEGAPAAR